MSSEDGLRLSRPSETGEVFKKEYTWWNIRKDWIPLRNVRGLLRMQAATSSIPPPNIGQVSILQTIRLGGGKSQEYEEQQCRRSASASSGCGQTATGRQNRGIWKLAERGFSGRLSSDRLTGGARKRNSGEHLRLVDFGQVIQTMVCREVSAA